MSSKRGYLSQTELEEFADITVTDATEADDQISMAEEIIDSYVGAQDKFFYDQIMGLASGGSATSLTLQTDQQNVFEKDYFKGMMVEVIGGTGAGQRQICTGSSKAGVLTTATFTTPLDNTSFYKIFQLGKFPRCKDVTYYTIQSPFQYYKSIPEMVKRAVAAQVEFIINKGAKFFASDKYSFNSETIGDYSYSKSRTGAGVGVDELIAPKAKLFLRGIKNRTGQLIL